MDQWSGSVYRGFRFSPRMLPFHWVLDSWLYKGKTSQKLATFDAWESHYFYPGLDYVLAKSETEWWWKLVAWWYLCSQKKHRPELGEVRGRGSKLNIRLKELAEKVEREDGRHPIRVWNHHASCSVKYARIFVCTIFTQRRLFVHKASFDGTCWVTTFIWEPQILFHLQESIHIQLNVWTFSYLGTFSLWGRERRCSSCAFTEHDLTFIFYGFFKVLPNLLTQSCIISSFFAFQSVLP